MGSSESTQRAGDTNNSAETEQARKERQDELEVAKKVAVAAGIAIVGWGISKLFESGSSSSSERKKMKAPGRKDYIYRDDFERDPKEYFRRLRD